MHAGKKSTGHCRLGHRRDSTCHLTVSDLFPSRETRTRWEKGQTRTWPGMYEGGAVWSHLIRKVQAT